MKDETKIWLDSAVENPESAWILLKSSLFNACLQKNRSLRQINQ